MYYVEALIPYWYQERMGEEWEDVYTVPQLETEQAELQKAREAAADLSNYYKHTRITKSTLHGYTEVVA